MNGQVRLAMTQHSTTVALLLFSCAVLLWKDIRAARQLESLRENQWGVDRDGLSEFLDAPHAMESGAFIVPRRIVPEFIVLTIFKPSDCLPCTDQVSALNEVANSASTEVIGVSSFFSASEATQMARQSSLRFHLILDQNGSILKKLRPPKTPWVVLIGTRSGRTLYETPPGMGLDESKYVVAQLRRMIGAYGGRL
jgi:hypothetical protein